MKALSPADTAFLLLEKRHQPMHVGGLFLAYPPQDAGPDFLQGLAERMRRATRPTSPFDKQLTRKLGAWFWERDEQFDVDHHFRHYALPRPGRIRELLRMVSQLHAAPLDRARPLWEMYLIDGVDGGRFAIYSKIHHSLVDGVAAMRILQKCLSEDPNDRDMESPWSAVRTRAPRDEEPAPGLAQLVEMLGSVPKVTREIARTILEVREDVDRYNDLRAPRCIFNQPISGSRRFAAQSYPLARIRAVGKAHNATLNDVVLAMCGSALRRYLLDLGELPDKPLIAMVPMSIRRDDSESGNQVAMILANLGTHLIDPAARLRTIQRSVQQAKDRYSAMTPGEILAYAGALLGPAGLNILTSAVPRVQAFNVVISNVPGPKNPLYLNGARIDGMYPVSIVVDGQALNLTLTSYVDKLELGVIACRRTLPHIQRLLDYLAMGLKELEGVSDSNELP